jgi:hypothetical protein
VDGKPPSAAQQQKAKGVLENLVNNPGARRKNRQAVDDDSHKSQALLKILPDAFLFTKEGEQNGNLRLSFRPNPHFDPPTREAKVFHHMQGTLVIQGKEMRLVSISGKLMSDVTFGAGLLGRLRKGGTFYVEQKEVAPGDFEVTRLDVHITGRALLFKTISEQQQQSDENFEPVPKNKSLAQLAELIQKTGGSASHSEAQ